jgi:hypothetical protein
MAAANELPIIDTLILSASDLIHNLRHNACLFYSNTTEMSYHTHAEIPSASF